jgi:hypothetical protein
MPYGEGGPNPSTVRLRSHPQVEETVVWRTVWAFSCPRCECRFKLFHAKPLADGTLVCRWCFGPEDEHDLLRCKQCGKMLPTSEFEREPDPAFDQTAAALGGYSMLIECRSCRRPRTPDIAERDCEHCGTSFTPSRSDARFCSLRCRVAAHRTRHALENSPTRDASLPTP